MQPYSLLHNKIMTKSLMVLPSIADCTKALEWLREAGRAEETDVELRGAVCPERVQGSNEEQDMLLGHRLVVLADTRLQCRVCGKVFRSKHRALTQVDRIVFARLDPSVPF